MDHDSHFKELLSVFFLEFVELFLPDVAGYLDPTSLEFLDKEIFTDVIAGEKHVADLVVKARFRDQLTFFLIHVENQASARSAFPMRMFTYFARLHEKYHLPVYPVVIFSYDKPRKAAPSRYEVAFPGMSVLQFEFKVIQLNRLSWRQFVQQPNPVATALMAKMQMTPQERPKVKLECFRLLATLKLNPAKSELIGRFIESYLKLNAEELRQYEREFAQLAPKDQEATMEVMTSWKREGIAEGIEKGIEQGLHKGKEGLITRQLQRRFGSMSSQMLEKLMQLSSDQLDELGVALIDFSSDTDLETWLKQHNPQ